jgi:hypothetical protein
MQVQLQFQCSAVQESSVYFVSQCHMFGIYVYVVSKLYSCVGGVRSDATPQRPA